MVKQREIRIIYSRLRHLISQIPLEKDKPAIEDSTTQQYHSIVDEVSDITGEDYSSFKVPESERENWASELLNEPPRYCWRTTPVRVKIMELIGKLRVEFDTEQDEVTLGRLLKEKIDSFWREYRWKTICTVLLLVVFLLVYLIFKVNLFGLINVDLEP